jgi:hypothetical protein
LLFATEVLIARFVHDRFVRPHLGDTLAVLLVYCGLRTIFPLRSLPAAIIAFAIAALIEFGQLADILDILGLRSIPIARVVLGSGFDPWDFVAYAAGAAFALAIERLRTGSRARS